MSGHQLKSGKEERHAYWGMQVKQWKDSNMKQQAYCTQAGINYSSFVYWKGMLSSRPHAKKSKSFVRVKVVSSDSATPANPAQQDIQIKLASGHTVCIPSAIDPKQLAALIHYLGVPYA
ncbi:MAG: hypothetical protein ABL857_05750 [Rickettsiales bacterium]